MAAAAIFSQLSDKFARSVCGVSSSPTATPDDDDRRGHKAELRSFLLLSPSSSPERRRPRRSVDDDDAAAANVTAASLAAVTTEEHGGGHEEEEEQESATLPCLAFASEHGYKVFSLAHMRMLDVRPMPPVPGRRLVPSPRGGTVLATDVCYRHPCHLADPFTGSRAAPLPDLPIPFSEKEPMDWDRRRDEPRGARARATDDGLAWDWSPRGVMVARGDTAFFCAHGGGESEQRRWTPVHRSRLGSHMTVNYGGGLFLVLERRTLETTVIDAGTLRARARIPAPPGLDLDEVDGADVAPSSDDDAILLVHRAARDRRGVLLFTEAYHARHRGSRRPPKWRPVLDIGDRAVFVDGAHGFTVTAGGPAGFAKANRVYAILTYRVTHPCGRLAVAHDVIYSDLGRPERVERMKLNAGEVERMWGHPHWIIPRDGSDPCQGSIIN